MLDAVGDAGNAWIFPELRDAGLAPWAGVRWVAIAGSPRPTHAVDVTETLEHGIASLAEHRAHLSALGEGSPEEQARGVYDAVTTRSAAGFDGRPVVALELVAG